MGASASAYQDGLVVGLDSHLHDVVGASAKKLTKAFGMETVRDLLDHLPRRYQPRGEMSDLDHLLPGEIVTVWARVEHISTRHQAPRGGSRRMLSITKVVIGDGKTSIGLTFFNQAFRERQLTVGTAAMFAGKVEVFRDNITLTNPEVQVAEELAELEAFAGSLIPIYPATAAISSWRIAQAVRLALTVVDFAGTGGASPAGGRALDAADVLPRDLRARHRLPTLAEAYVLVHQPEELRDVHRGIRRLAWDEAMVIQTILAQRRLTAARLPAVPRPQRAQGLSDAFDAALPFTLTTGQHDIGAVIAAELEQTHPMHRLLQGEVGSGKTLIAVRAMLQTVDAGGQAALLAPTEVLAQQHARALAALLGPLARAGEIDGPADGVTATRIALLTGSQTAAQRRRALDQIATGAAGLVVGTHALLELTVQWRELGLVVVDEQHRFGVEQRDLLRRNGAAAGATPHVLVMTATPIPRTVAMTVFGDLEVSSLTELPRGRQPISTSVVPPEKPGWLDRVWQRIRTEVDAGHQAYVVVPRIAPGETAGDGPELPSGTALEDVLPLLADGVLAGLRIAPLHGRLTPEEKDSTMLAFSRGQLDVLVATTVIEVGVDVPNATVMVVLDADRFGVSQLHQLRGRVGRGSAASWCLLQTAAEVGTPARERVDAVASTLDGAELARVDLSARREGDVLGVAQSGRRKTLRVLDLLKHEEIVVAAREEAMIVVTADPTLDAHPGLAGAVYDAMRSADPSYLEKG